MSPHDAPQPQAVVTPLTEAAIFLTLTIEPGGADAVRDVLADVDGLRRSVGFRIPEGRLTCVTGIGSEAWDRLFGGPRPAELHPFIPLVGPRHTAPATPGDLLFHIRANRADLCFELAQRIVRRLAGAATVVDEVHGFRSFDERDLLGFVDGTENPENGDAVDAAIIGDEDPAFTGGSYVIVQKYRHDLDGWDALPIEAQERAIGRSKLDDLEFPDDEKAPDAHIVLNQVTDADGEEQDILRLNMPFGAVGAGEYGTYFIGYCRTPAVTEEMLRNMFLGKPAGTTDRILDFSTAVTGCLFFVPAAGFLDDPPAAAMTQQPAPDDTDANAPEPPQPDGSLGIGSLKGSPT